MSDGRNGQSSAGTLKQRLWASGSWTVAARVIAGLSGFLVNALLSRMLSPADLGAYFLLISVATAGALFAQLGLQLAVVRLASQALADAKPARARGVIVRALGIACASAVLAGVIAGAAGDSLALKVFGSVAIAQVSWLGGAWLAGAVIAGVTAEAFRGLHNYALAGVIGGAAINAALLILLAIAFGFSVRPGFADVVALSTAVVLAIAMVGLLAMRVRLRRLGPAAPATTAEVLAVSLPLLVTTGAIFISTQADIWILGAKCSQDEVAMYSTALRLVQLVMMPLLMMNTVLAPVIAEQFARGRKAELERVLRASAAITGLPALVALGAMGLAAGPVLGWVYGSYYEGGATALLWVSAGQAVNVLSGSAAIVLMMTGHQRAVMTISVVTGVGLVAGALFVASDYGMNGVAVVAGTMTAVHGIACALWVRRATGMSTLCSPGGLVDFAKQLRGLVRATSG